MTTLVFLLFIYMISIDYKITLYLSFLRILTAKMSDLEAAQIKLVYVYVHMSQIKGYSQCIQCISYIALVLEC